MFKAKLAELMPELSVLIRDLNVIPANSEGNLYICKPKLLIHMGI